MIESYWDREPYKNLFYYTVGDKRFQSDLQAYKYFSKNLNNEIRFNIGLKLMEMDWTKEPTESIEHYRQLLCARLEDMYSNIMLGYSGGTDSETILECFFRRGTKNLTMLNIVNTLQQHTETRQWLRDHTNQAVQQKWGQVARQRNWNFRMWEAWQPTSHESFEKDLTDYKSGSWTVEYRYLNAWSQNSGQKTLTRNKGKKTCLVMGKEKPELVIEDGWWCYKTLNLAWERPFDCVDPSTDLVMFWTNDIVPELCIKLAHAKAIEMEKVFIENNIKPTTNNSIKQSIVMSPNYTRLNAAMGMKALTPFLDGNAQKTFGWFKKKEFEEQIATGEKDPVNKKIIADRVFDEVLTKQIDNRFLDFNNKNLHGIWGKPIKVRPVCQQLREML